MMLEYPCDQKGYKLLDLSKNTIFASRDLNFEENIFLFREKISENRISQSRYPIFLEEEMMHQETLNSNHEEVHNDNPILQHSEFVLEDAQIDSETQECIAEN